MKKFNLIRISEVGPTLGVLLDGNLPFCLTLERPWLNNERGLSCIPFGDYHCKRIISPKFGETFQVMNVLERSEILFHKGNIVDDTHGCIIVGEMFGILNIKNAVLSSGAAFEEFMERLRGHNTFDLDIWPNILPKGG